MQHKDNQENNRHENNKYKIKHFSLRISSDQLYKFRYIANSHARSANGQLLHMITNEIVDYEELNGRIEVPENLE